LLEEKGLISKQGNGPRMEMNIEEHENFLINERGIL